MKVKTIVRCFGLLITVGLIVVLIQTVLVSFFNFKPSPVHEIMPINSLQHIGQRLVEKNRETPESLRAKVLAQEIKYVTLFLKNGNEVRGIIESEDSEWINMSIDGSKVGFHRSEIKQIITANPS